MQIVTGHTGEKHVSAQDDSIRNVMLGEFGGRGVFPVFDQFAATAITANEVRVGSGYGCNQGRLFKIDRNSYDSCVIENGSVGYKRVDLIVARYLKNEQTGIESCRLVVIKGTPDENSYIDPEYTVGNILNGALQDDMPMYRVKIDGITIDSIERMCTIYGSLIGGVETVVRQIVEDIIEEGTDVQVISRLSEDFAPVEESTTSAHAYSVGDLLVLNNYLYRVTADISIGNTLAVGTNIERRTVEDEIKGANNAIDTLRQNTESAFDGVDNRIQSINEGMPRYFEFDTDNMTAGHIDVSELGFGYNSVVIGYSMRNKADNTLYYASYGMMGGTDEYGIQNVQYYEDEEHNVRVSAGEAGLPAGYICRVVYINLA
jgi:hypothetical protein